MCSVAQIIGGTFSAGVGKLKVTPGWKTRHEAVFLSALHRKTTDRRHFHGNTSESSLTEGEESLWQTQPYTLPTLPVLPINLSYPELNMSRVNVTLRLC